MGTLLLHQIKKQASFFLQERYKTARLALTDVTEAELLTEEATNTDPWGPDARTMTRIAEASFDVDDYWRIADVLHRRLYNVDWKQWRQSYKSLILLEFLLTHGLEDFAQEFVCDSNTIQQLGRFEHIDEKGFDWGANMQKKSERILELLEGGKTLRDARLQALKITKEIEGFGNFSPSSETSRAASFGSYSSPSSNEMDELNKPEEHPHGGIGDDEKPGTFPSMEQDAEGSHRLKSSSVQESGFLLDREAEDGEKTNRFIDGVRSKLLGGSPSRCNYGEKVNFRSFSDVGRAMKKRFDRQFSIGY